jgi:hypothetical protein
LAAVRNPLKFIAAIARASRKKTRAPTLNASDG